MKIFRYIGLVLTAFIIINIVALIMNKPSTAPVAPSDKAVIQELQTFPNGDCYVVFLSDGYEIPLDLDAQECKDYAVGDSINL